MSQFQLARGPYTWANTHMFCLQTLTTLLDSVKAAAGIVDAFEHTWSIIIRGLHMDPAAASPSSSAAAAEISPPDVRNQIQQLTVSMVFSLARNGAFGSLMHEEETEECWDDSLQSLPVVDSLIAAMNTPGCQAQYYLFVAIVMLGTRWGEAACWLNLGNLG